MITPSSDEDITNALNQFFSTLFSDDKLVCTAHCLQDSVEVGKALLPPLALGDVPKDVRKIPLFRTEGCNLIPPSKPGIVVYEIFRFASLSNFSVPFDEWRVTTVYLCCSVALLPSIFSLFQDRIFSAALLICSRT